MRMIAIALINMFVLAAVSASTPPDINADGHQEVLVAPAAFSRTNQPVVTVACGATGDPIRRITLGVPDTAFGWRCAWIADCDGDSKADIIVCEPLAMSSTGLGRAHAYSSGTGQRLRTFAPSVMGQFAVAVGTIADRNSDGHADIVIWSLARPSGTTALAIPWIYSSQSGALLWPSDETAAILALRADVNGDDQVTIDDAVEVVDEVGEPVQPENEPLDVNQDESIDEEDVIEVIANEGLCLPPAPAGISFLGWSSLDPMAGQIVASDEMPQPPVSPLYAIPGPAVIAPIAPIDDGEGGGGSGGGGSGGPPPDPYADDNPNDPFDNGPSCSPKVTRTSRYMCLRPEEEDGCTEFELTASGGSGNESPVWSIVGGVFLVNGSPQTTAEGYTVTVQVCTPGQVAVTVGRPAHCAYPRQRIFRVVRVDVDIDSDNTSLLAAPTRTIFEELVEAAGQINDKPGKVIRTGYWDSDGDGLSDAVDGINCIDGPTIDDSSPHEVPTVVISIEGPMETNAAVVLGYPASDPATIGATGDPFAVAPGSLRLWTANTDQPRDPRPITDDGNYVPAGVIPLGVLFEKLGPPPWTLFVEAVNHGLASIAVQVDPDGVNPPPVEGQPPGGPEPVLCPDGVQITGTEIVLKALGCGDCDEVELAAFSEVREEDPTELDDPADFFDRYVLYSLAIRDWRDFGTAEVGGVPVPLSHLGTDGSRSEWFYIAASAHANAPGGAIRLDIPTGWTWISYNPITGLPNLWKRLNEPHCREFAKRMRAITDRARAGFNPMTTDHGHWGKLVHQEAAAEFATSPRWKSSVWIDLDTRKVVGVGAPPSPHPNTERFAELDMAYMKRGKTVIVGQTFQPDDLLDNFEIKTTANGGVDEQQVRRITEAMNGRKPTLVQPFFKQMRVAPGSTQWAVVQNDKAIRRAKALGRAGGTAGTGLLLIGAAMMIGSENVDEDTAFDMLLESVAMYRRFRDSDYAQARLAMLDVVDRMRTWLVAATGDPLVAAIATKVFAEAWIAAEWD